MKPAGTDWEALYQARDTGWDKGAPSPVLSAYLSESPLRGRVLVPGCGRGHDARAVAAADATAEVIGMDLAPSAVAEAQALGGPANLRFVAGDLLAEAPAGWAASFDAVVEHTCYCAIDRGRRDEYAGRVAALLKPGGLLVAIFYLMPREDPDPAIGPPFNATVPELDERFGGRFELLRSEVPAVAFPGREGRELLRVYRRSPSAK